MFRFSRFHLRVALYLIFGFAASLSPLRAQLDPRLQGSCADFLDLFQKSNTLKVKPEIVTVFDFSGSMGSLMYHPNFVNTDTTDSYSASDMRFTTALVSGVYVCTATLSINGWTLTASSNSATNPLIRPDGSVLTAANINTNYVVSVPALPGETASPKSADVRNWIRCLSHVRFTRNGRTLDIPVPWTILDDPSITPGSGEFRKMYNTYPLKMTILDPNTGAAPGTEYEMDTRYRVAGNSLISSSGTVPLTSNTVNNSSGMYRGPYFTWLFSAASAPYIPDTSTAAGRAFKNGIPARSRASAVKDAAMRTWANHYNKVLWAYRFLNDAGSNLENSHGTTLYNDSRNVIPADPRFANVIGGTQRGWYLLNKGSLLGLQRLAAYQCSSATPLTYAMGNTLAQLNDPNNIFNDVETTANDLKPVECMKHFLILFTDGIPNSDGGGENTNTPYVSGTTFDANTGNGTIIADKTTMNPGGSGSGTNYWNIMNLAAVAAHLGDPALTNHMVPPAYPVAGTYSTSGGASGANWLPYFITTRGTGTDQITYDPGHPHPIYTMTVGVSLGGNVSDSGSPKRRMFLAAAFGDPKRIQEADISTLVPFRLTNPLDPNSKDPKSVYFFDGTDPKTLVDNLDQAFSEAGALSNVNATSSPNLPFVGGSLGKQVYLGKFQPPKSGGAIWSGDLLMFATKEVGGQTKLLDTAGNVASVLDATTAQWSGNDALNANRLWSARNLYTRIPGSVGTPEPGLMKFSDLDPAYSALKPYLATSVPLDSDKKQVIQFIAGANTGGTYDTSTPPRPNTNRNIMGDVIDSGPAAIEYNWAQIQASGKLTPKLAAFSGGNRFRLILVGTNQGWLHAFGEVTKVSTIIDSNGNPQEVVQGVVDELWSYLPTDFLGNLDYMQNTANPHRFLVDGTPTIYHLDLPISGGPGNGVVDLSTPSGPERAIAVVGLRKGGRSYYALDIHDPFTPAMKWSLVPDEYAAFPASRTLVGGPGQATVQNVLKNMGYSSCTPGLGRVLFNGSLKDAVFLGGGYSVPEIETNFGGAKLGRSVMAVDVFTGQVLAAVDLTAKVAGPVAAGVVPFEFILNSGMAQRAYFLDYKGGLWAWGSMETSNSTPFVNYRMDTSDLANWTTNSGNGGSPRTQSDGTNSNAGIRKVAQDGSGGNNAIYSTLPAPFRVGYFPGVAKTAASPAPAAVGIAMISGDRNNPVDYCYTALSPKPTDHRLTVVFDRQDSKDTLAGNMDTLGIQDSNLEDFTTAPVASTTFTKTTPGKPDYYLAPYTAGTPPTPIAPKFGYRIQLPGIVLGGYVPKGINEPIVVAGSLFYSYFNPTAADPCAGGAGLTFSQLVCDVINPAVDQSGYSGPALACNSGTQFTWSGVASNYIAFGTRGVIQAGVVAVSGPPPPSGSATTLELKTLLGKQQERFPKVRVWRTVR